MPQLIKQLPVCCRSSESRSSFHSSSHTQVIEPPGQFCQASYLQAYDTCGVVMTAIHGHLGRGGSGSREWFEFSKYLTLFYTRHKNYILVLIYYVFCGKSPPFLFIQLFYPSRLQHWKQLFKKLVIKAVSINILLFDLNVYKVYLAEIRYTEITAGREGKHLWT